MVPIILTQQAWDLLTQPGGHRAAWVMTLSDAAGNELSPLSSSAGARLTASILLCEDAVDALFQKLSSINFCPCRALDFSTRGAAEVLSTAVQYICQNMAYLKVCESLERRGDC